MNIQNFIFLFLFITVTSFGQTQHKIPWPSLGNTPWPTFRGDMQGTGRSEYVGPESCYVKWRADLSLGIFNGPVIGFNNKLFFGTYSLAPGSNNYFYAYNPDSTAFWQYSTPSRYPNKMSPLICTDSTVYFLTNETVLFALSFNGLKKWSRYIGLSGTQLAMDKTGNLYISLLDTLKIIKPDGSTLLNKYFPKIYTNITFSPDGETIYFKSGEKGVDTTFLNATDLMGNLKWQRKIGFYNYGHCPIDNQGNIYVFGDSLNYHYLFSFDNAGNIRWKYPALFSDFGSPCIDRDGNIIFAKRNNDYDGWYKIISLNNNGAFNWEFALGHNDDPDHGLVCDAKGNIYFGSTYGTYFFALNNSGQLLWKLPLEGLQFDNSPAIGSDGTLYIGTHVSSFYFGITDNLIAISNNASTGIKDNLKVDTFNLYQNYPNPFNPTTTIKYSIKKGGFVSLDIYDVLGNRISTLVNEQKEAGEYEESWDASKYSSGVYFYRIKAGSYIESRKMILVK